MALSRTARRTWIVAAALVVAVTVIGAVLFTAPGRETSPGMPGPGTPMPGPAAMMTVTVWFHRGAADDPARVLPVERTVPRSEAVATAAVGQLLGGPTAQEQASGYFSFFGPGTADALIGVRVANGVARADFHDFRTVIPNAGSSFGSAALVAELDATLEQFPTVTSTVYSFDGDVAAFYEWLQLTPPIGADGVAAAVSTARRFLTDVAGMQPEGGTFRPTGEVTGEVTFAARGPRGEPLPGITTVVAVERDGGWTATGAATPTIAVDVPAPGQAITSPLEARGRSVAFEGTVTVRVLADAITGTTEAGSGFVTGGADAMGPFSGPIAFTAPPASTSGWVVFSEQSAADGSVLRATVVRVGFGGGTAEPAISQISWQPEIALENGWLLLPDGAGSVTFTVQAVFTDRVHVVLTPTGTGTASEAQVLGQGTRTDTGFVFTWDYPDEPQLGHLSFVATGPGGRAEDQPFNVYHG